MLLLPPLILPGGGRFKIGSSPLNVSLRSQILFDNESNLNENNFVLRWRFSMSPPGRSSADNGPVIEGRIPARDSMSFEEGYQFCPGKIGYRTICESTGEETNNNSSPPTFIFSLPGIYKVFAWIENLSTGETSRTQYCVFEIVVPTSGAPSSLVHGVATTSRLGA